MPPRKLPEYTCDMPRCNEKATALGLCPYHYHRWLYLKKKVKNKTYSLKYQLLNDQLNRSSDIKLKRDLERKLKQLPEFKAVHKEIKHIEYYMNPLYAYRSSKVSPKKGLRQRKRKFYVPKGRKPKEICKECGEPDRFAVTKGLCKRCYERKRQEKNNLDICHVEGCSTKPYSLWLCRKHYDRWRKTRHMVKTRRYNTELDIWVDRAEDKTLHPDIRKKWDKKIDERIHWGGHESDKFLKIRKEFEKLDAAVNPEWSYKYKKKHEKPPAWTGYKKYGPYSTRLKGK